MAQFYHLRVESPDGVYQRLDRSHTLPVCEPIPTANVPSMACFPTLGKSSGLEYWQVGLSSWGWGFSNAFHTFLEYGKTVKAVKAVLLVLGDDSSRLNEASRSLIPSVG